MTEVENFRHPDQPTLIYDNDKPWEDVVAAPPMWLGDFPKKPTEKKYTLFGEPTISPMIIAAGPASGKLWTDFYLKMGFGAVIEKTKRTRERRSNPLHNIAIVNSELAITDSNIDEPRLGSLNPDDWNKFHSMTNSFGNPSSSLPTWTAEFRRQLTSVEDGQILAISVTPTVEASDSDLEDALREKIVADTMLAIAAAVGAGAKKIEINDACPNVTGNKIEGEMFQDHILINKTFRQARILFPEIYLGLKVGRFASRDQAERVLDAAGANIDFISTINALSVPIIDNEGNPILVGRERAGTCGDILREISLRQTAMIADIREKANHKYEIHAGGGINLPEHVEQYRNAGGDGFFSGSGVLANPLLNNDYLYWLQENS